MRLKIATDLRPVVQALPTDFRLVVADVGSIGGLHKRWAPVSSHLVTMSFDPLDSRRADENSRTFHFLLSNSNGEAVLKITRRSSMSSTLDPDRAFFEPFWRKGEDVDVVETISAPVTSLDRIVAAEGLLPDAIKVDVQGAEGMVLDGAAETLKTSAILVEVECSFAERYRGQRTFDEIVAQMRGLGFGLLDLRRLKRYRYRNTAGIEDPSLGRGMRAGRLAFCDAIFTIEPAVLWSRIAEGGGANGPQLGLKAIMLFLIYGKADLAAATFDAARETIPNETRAALTKLFASLEGDGGWRQRLHHRFDDWSRRS